MPLSESKFDVRIVTVDYYMGTPIHGLDVTYSDFRGSEIKHVPVIRVFGTTSKGQKACVHVHGVFPYICIPYDGEEAHAKQSYQIAASLDKAINISLGSSNADVQHVYKVVLVSGIPFYGYHRKACQFFKIYFYKPAVLKQAIVLLQNGAILNKIFQPHEAHVPFILQFFIDFNLYGMSYIQFSHVMYRRNSHTESLEIPENILLPSNVEPLSTSELEADVSACDILNRITLSGNDRVMNPGLRAILEDERKRRAEDETFFETPQLHSQRPVVAPTASHLHYYKELLEKLIVSSPEANDSVNSDTTISGVRISFPIETPLGSGVMDSSQLDLHISRAGIKQPEDVSSCWRDETIVNADVAISFSADLQHASQAVDRNVSFDLEENEILAILGNLVEDAIDSDSVLGTQKSQEAVERCSSAGNDDDDNDDDTDWLDITVVDDGSTINHIPSQVPENLAVATLTLSQKSQSSAGSKNDDDFLWNDSFWNEAKISQLDGADDYIDEKDRRYPHPRKRRLGMQLSRPHTVKSSPKEEQFKWVPRPGTLRIKDEPADQGSETPSSSSSIVSIASVQSRTQQPAESFINIPFPVACCSSNCNHIIEEHQMLNETCFENIIDEVVNSENDCNGVTGVSPIINESAFASNNASKIWLTEGSDLLSEAMSLLLNQQNENQLASELAPLSTTPEDGLESNMSPCSCDEILESDLLPLSYTTDDVIDLLESCDSEGTQDSKTGNNQKSDYEDPVPYELLRRGRKAIPGPIPKFSHGKDMLLAKKCMYYTTRQSPQVMMKGFSSGETESEIEPEDATHERNVTQRVCKTSSLCKKNTKQNGKNPGKTPQGAKSRGRKRNSSESAATDHELEKHKNVTIRNYSSNYVPKMRSAKENLNYKTLLSGKNCFKDRNTTPAAESTETRKSVRSRRRDFRRSVLSLSTKKKVLLSPRVLLTPIDLSSYWPVKKSTLKECFVALRRITPSSLQDICRKHQVKIKNETLLNLNGGSRLDSEAIGVGFDDDNSFSGLELDCSSDFSDETEVHTDQLPKYNIFAPTGRSKICEISRPSVQFNRTDSPESLNSWKKRKCINSLSQNTDFYNSCESKSDESIYVTAKDACEQSENEFHGFQDRKSVVNNFQLFKRPKSPAHNYVPPVDSSCSSVQVESSFNHLDDEYVPFSERSVDATSRLTNLKTNSASSSFNNGNVFPSLAPQNRTSEKEPLFSFDSDDEWLYESWSDFPSAPECFPRTSVSNDTKAVASAEGRINQHCMNSGFMAREKEHIISQKEVIIENNDSNCSFSSNSQYQLTQSTFQGLSSEKPAHEDQKSNSEVYQKEYCESQSSDVIPASGQSILDMFSDYDEAHQDQDSHDLASNNASASEMPFCQTALSIRQLKEEEKDFSWANFKNQSGLDFGSNKCSGSSVSEYRQTIHMKSLKGKKNSENLTNVFVPLRKPPSTEEVKNSLSHLGISEVINTEPFFGNVADVKGKKEVGGRVLKISSLSVAHLQEHQCSLEEINGLHIQQKRLFLNHWRLDQPSSDVADLIRSYHGSQNVVIVPVKKPPSFQEIHSWMLKKIYKKKEKDCLAPSSEQKTEVLVNLPPSPVHLDIDNSADIFKISPISENFDGNKHKVANHSTPCLTAPHKLSTPTYTPIGLKTKEPKKALKSKRCLHHQLKNVNENSCFSISKSEIDVLEAEKCDAAQTTHSKVEKTTKNYSFEILNDKIENEVNLQSYKVPNVSGYHIEDVSKAAGFKMDLENLQEAKSAVEHQYITIMNIELHIRTCGELKPNPERDSIQAVFFCVTNDVPENHKLPKQITGIVAVDDRTFEGPLLRGNAGHDTVSYVQDEKSLIEKVTSLVRNWDPDILVGYEVEMLSWGYLIQRAFVLEINLTVQLSRVPSQKQSKNLDAAEDNNGVFCVNLPGRIILDTWRLFKSELALQSYTFENVMYHTLHERVPLYTLQTLSYFWDYPTHRFRWIAVKHYQTRVVGLMRMMDQLDLVGRTSELARLFGIQFFEVLSRGSQFRVESMMLRLAKPKNYIPVSPSVQQRARMRAPENIPLIMEPESRLYCDPVIVLDFQSLYPSIIIAYNYCFSTCLGRVEHLGRSSPYPFGCTQLQISKARLRNLMDHSSFSPCGVAFVTKDVRTGVLPSMLEEILEARLAVKQSMKRYKNDSTLQRVLHARQLGLKLIANVTYGYTSANFSGRMPCSEIGDSVVSKGRETLERAIALVHSNEQWRARVVYGDTDSMFVLVPGRDRLEAFRIGKEIADAVTQDNPSPVKLKLEKVYQPSILQTKKRYVGYMYESPEQQEPIYEAKGIETVRRDGCPAVAKMLEKSLRLLFETRDVSVVKRYVCRQFSKILEGKVSIQDFIFAREYRGMASYRPGACVPALELTRRWLVSDRRAEPRVGERVPYVIVNGPPGSPLIRLVRHPSELLADPALRINAVYYITRAIIPPLERCFSLIGADIFSWYADIPRKFQNGSVPTVINKSKKTISQYFSALECVCCGLVTHEGVCASCRAKPQFLATQLSLKLHLLESSVIAVNKVCGSCEGRLDSLKCVSLDCPILYRRHRATTEYEQRDCLQQLFNECFL